jgi:uncharacterized membrane protein
MHKKQIKQSEKSAAVYSTERNITPFFVYAFYIAVVLVWNASIILPPLIALNWDVHIANSFYQFHSNFCHQRLDRSFCFFSDGSFGDCMKENAVAIQKNPSTGRSHGVVIGEVKGFELAACARDNGVYFGMLIGALLLPFFKKIESTEAPQPIYLILAIIPLAIDGTGQLIGLWESTNLMRVVTGFIAGFVVPIYLLPMLNSFLLSKEHNK